MDKTQRGLDIKRRRVDLGIGTIKEFARATTRLGNRDVRGVSVDAITAAEKGEASENTYDRLESWLDMFEEEVGATPARPAPADEDEGKMASIRIGALDITVSAPVENVDELVEAVKELMRGAPRPPSSE